MKLAWLFLFSSLFAAQIELGGNFLQVEIADTDELRAKGLSGRTSLPENTGMLFVFEPPRYCSFWMKDTKIPLSLGFFDSEMKLVQWIDMLPPDQQSKSMATYKSPEPIQYALEVPMGWFKKNQIKPGEKLNWVETSPTKSFH